MEFRKNESKNYRYLATDLRKPPTQSTPDDSFESPHRKSPNRWQMRHHLPEGRGNSVTAARQFDRFGPESQPNPGFHQYLDPIETPSVAAERFRKCFFRGITPCNLAI